MKADRFTKLLLIAGLAIVAVFPVDARQHHDGVSANLSRVITHEMLQKDLPAVYVLLVQGNDVVWSHAFGYADPQKNIPATVEDVHRIASVSKLFTDIGLMQLVEQGLVDLDSPIVQYLPDFRPHNPFGKEITLRQLMTHRSGLVREPPVGSYFDPTEPSLTETIASLNSTTLVYSPATRFKYSNAGIGVVGLLIERMRRKPFARVIDETVLNPLGMKNSSFEPRPELLQRKPRAILWTYDGRKLDVPGFQFGMGPAANMYSTTGDLGKFLIALFKGGTGENGTVLRKETLEEMWTPQFRSGGEKTGVGLGFFIGSKEGHRTISHSGDVYGFATEVAAIPDLKLGAVVITTMNAANAWSTSIADHALDLLLAASQGKRLPEYVLTRTVDSVLCRQLEGTYAGRNRVIRFFTRGNQLWMQGSTMRLAVQQHDGGLMIDDKISRGMAIVPTREGVIVGSDTLSRIADAKPPATKEFWKAFIGEYGWDHNTLYIQERHGILHAQIEWYFSYPLTERSPDVFDFPDYGLYHGEQVRFRRDDKGKITGVFAAGVLFPRRLAGTDDGSTFTITPQKPLEQLRREALASLPPREQGTFRPPRLVELVTLDSTLRLDIRYATTNNFMKSVFYAQPRAFMQQPAAEALVRAHQWLKQFGYGILVHDAYRPWYVTKMFWDATPQHQRDFVADPSQGSRHNRGCAADVSLVDLATGTPVEMVSGYDEFSVRAYPDYPGGTSLQHWHRELLRRALEDQGFEVYVYEWWHFDFKEWREFPLLNQAFDEIEKKPAR